MTLYDRRKKKLIADLGNKEYREAFVAEHIYTGIPFQIKALRKQKQRNWTQEELGNRAKMFQERIRVLENPDNESLTIKTLLKLASAFGVGLDVKFVPISELAEWDLNLSPDSLEAIGYDDDPYFKETQEPIAAAVDNSKYVTDGESAATNSSVNVIYLKDRDRQNAHMSMASSDGHTYTGRAAHG